MSSARFYEAVQRSPALNPLRGLLILLKQRQGCLQVVSIGEAVEMLSAEDETHLIQLISTGPPDTRHFVHTGADLSLGFSIAQKSESGLPIA